MTFVPEHYISDRRAELEGMTKRELIEFSDQLERDAGFCLEQVAGDGRTQGTVTSFSCPQGYGAFVTVELPHAVAGDELTLRPGARVTIV